jgi:TetR/AcrR family transcriptional regulator, cholesterol catabolism regulator
MLEAAAQLLSTSGFAGTSMRMVAQRARVRAASLYYHFPSKAEMMVAVYEESAKRMSECVREAIGEERDPWRRLELAWAAHLRALLGGVEYVAVAFTESPRRFSPDLRERLIAERDRYEDIFRDLVDALPIRGTMTRKYFKLALFGAGAWSRMWYRPDGSDTPEKIAANILAIVRAGAETTPLDARVRSATVARR